MYEIEMTSFTFNNVFDRTRINHKYREPLRQILLDGKEQTEVANELGVSKQVISSKVKRLKSVAQSIPLDKFDHVFLKANIDDIYQDALYECLVEGSSLEKVVNRYGLDHKKTKFYAEKIIDLCNDIPADWISCVITLPNHFRASVEALKMLEEQELQKVRGY